MSAAEDFDSDALAALATGQAEASTTTTDDAEGADTNEQDDAGDEGGDGSTSSTTSARDGVEVREMLMSTEPHKPLSEVEAPYDPENGGWPRIHRAGQKIFGFDGVPAIMDLAAGIVELVTGVDPTPDDADAGESEGAGPVPGGEGV